MKPLLRLLAVCLFLVACGCGKEDLNKDLKPVDPNGPKPQIGGAEGGKSKTGDKPAAIMK